MQEIIEYIPNEGEPVLISGPKPLHPPEKQPAPKEDYLLRSMDLDNSFIEERGKGVSLPQRVQIDIGVDLFGKYESVSAIRLFVPAFQRIARARSPVRGRARSRLDFYDIGICVAVV